MATIQNARDVYLQAESPRLLPVTISNDFTFNGNATGTINGVPAATVTTGAGNGTAAHSGTVNYRNDVAPTNAVSSASSPTVVNNNDGSRDITLTWTYTDGAVPADGFILFYREGTGTVLSTDAGIQLPATARSFRFQGVHQGTAYRGGIAAFRRTESGIKITSIYQPTSAPDWRVSATTVNITADINGMSSSTLTSRATSGYDIQQKLEAGGSVILTGQVVPINAGGFKVGTIAWNTTTGALLSGTGIAITEFGIIGASSGVETFTINALTGAPTFKGDISGGANIDITGKGVFGGGSVSGGIQAAIHANTSYNADYGIQAFSGALVGASAVIGYSANGYGVRGEAQSSGGVGVKAGNAYGGVALVVGGKMTISSTTLVANLNADMLDGFHATSLCNVVTTNTGTCTVSGGGFQNLVTGPLASTVQTRGTGNVVYIENISDARLKTDIQDESLGLDFINSLRPRSFRMLSSQSVKSHGLIYQEVSELLSECDSLAMLNDNEIGGVDYNGIVSPIIKAIQQLSDSVDQLKQEK
jgi:hypothetical protein